MKIFIYMVISLIFSSQFAVAGSYWETKDGIDKRVRIAKSFLTQKMGIRKINSLDFNNAVIHTKDSLVHYIKVPYKNANKNGLFIIKSDNGKLDCVGLTIEGYKRKDTALSRYFRIVEVHYPLDKRPAKTLIIDKWGRIEHATIKNDNAYQMDSIYKVVYFFLFASYDHLTYTVYLNVGLLFDNIDSLNHKAYHDGIIRQDIIRLAFNSEPCSEFEFDNSKVLPGIDIKKMFSAFDAKADSVKKQ